MNCRRIEELIPLYIGGDLEADKADAVLAHTQACADCRELVAEYEESQNWLRSYTPPAFDDASLNDLKMGVLREINRGRGQVTFFHSLTRLWNRRLILATSVALLIIFGALAFYIHQSGAGGTGSDGELTAGDAGHGKQLPEAAPQPDDVEAAPRAGFIRQRHHRAATFSRKVLAAHGAGHIGPTVKRLDKRAVEPAVAIETNRARATDPAGSQELLRIEIQTSDPAIRIIWFSPKENSSGSSKPTTETD